LLLIENKVWFFDGDHVMKKIFFLASLTGAMCMALANCPNVPIPDRYVLNGDEATDKRTGLIWKRCTEKLAVYNKNTLDCDSATTSIRAQSIKPPLPMKKLWLGPGISTKTIRLPPLGVYRTSES
jgi:hypothetical protein